MPHSDREWQAYQRHLQAGGFDKDFAAKLGMKPNNFPRWKRRHQPDVATINDIPVETIDLGPAPTPHLPQKIALASLCVTAGTQMREAFDLAVIAEYAEAMEEGAKFPPVIVFSDGDTCWLADGFQRVKAAEQIGYIEVAADIRPGTLRDAILYACGANSQHGLRRTNADKRKSVLTLLNDPEWAQFSDRHIAEICGVTHPFVAEMRQPKEVRHPKVVTVTTPDDQTPIETPKTPPEVHPIHREPPSHELPFTPDGEAQPPVGITFRTTTMALCPTCERVRPLLAEAVAQVEYLGEAANVRGYAEYVDLQDTLRALQRAVDGQAVHHDA